MIVIYVVQIELRFSFKLITLLIPDKTTALAPPLHGTRRRNEERSSHNLTVIRRAKLYMCASILELLRVRLTSAFQVPIDVELEAYPDGDYTKNDGKNGAY